MDQDNRGSLMNRMKAWANRLWNITLKTIAQMIVVEMEKSTMKNLKSAEPSAKKSPTQHEMEVNFQVGKYIKFIDLLGDASAWDMDPIEFKILNNYIGKSGKVIDNLTIDGVPDEYNLFVTVQFSDGYVVYDASYYAFGPPDLTVYDFNKEKERRVTNLHRVKE